MLTVVPASKLSANVEPAGTVKPLTLIVMHATAAVTSLSDEIVPVHALTATDRRATTRA
jgi:hypothetical protein